MTGREIFDHLNGISSDEKMEFTASLTKEQLNEWNKVIQEELRSERIKKIQNLTGREIFDLLDSMPFDEKSRFTASLTNEQLDEWHKVIQEGLRSTNKGYGIINKKHSTRHKKRRGKKTRKYKY